MYRAPCGSTIQSVYLRKGLYSNLPFLSPVEINKMCLLCHYPTKEFPICEFGFWPPLHRPGLCIFNYPVYCILLRVMVFSLDGIHQTLHSGIQCLSAMLFHHSLILCIFRCTGKQPHCPKTPVIEWMESQSCRDLKFQSNSRIHCNLPASTVFDLVLMGLIKDPKTP